VACFLGVEGQVEEVLSIDVNQSGSMLLSAGMDNVVKIWQLDKPEIQNAIEESYAKKNSG